MFSYDRRASQDSLVNAVYGVITRMLVHAQPGLIKLDGASPHLGSFTQNGHLTSLTVEGNLLLSSGAVAPTGTWSITLEASLMHGDLGIDIEINGTSNWQRNVHEKLAFGGYSDSKDLANEIVRKAIEVRKKLNGLFG